MNKKSSVEILENIYQSMSKGIRSSVAQSPLEWLRDKHLSYGKTYAAFNSGQMHHRKEQAFIDELLSVGFLKVGRFCTNVGKTGYSSFGNFSMVFPLRDEENHIVNFYEMGIKKQSSSYMNDTGIYPCYPHHLTKKLFIVNSVLDAATVLDSEILGKKEAVIALHRGEIMPQHKQAIAALSHLEEVIYLTSSKPLPNPKDH